MQLLLASYYYPPSTGGVEKTSHLLARGLVERGHSVHVISARQPGNVSFEIRDGVHVVRVSAGRGSRWQTMLTYIAGMLAATWRLVGSTDLIHVQQVLYPAAAMALALPILRRPLVVTNHGSGYFGGVRLMGREPLGALGLALVARAATSVSLNTEMTTEMREVGFRRIVQIPNGVELPPAVTAADRSHARDALRVSGKVALYVGRLDAEKGVDGLIRAWRTVHTRVDNATLLIVGHGPEQRRLEHLLREHPLSAASVQLRGAVRDVRPYLQAADLFILPSRSEGISIALLEALAAGLPVVATEVGGNREVLGGSDVGVLVPPNDPEHLASAISDALAAELDRDRVAAAARTHVAENFSLGHVVDAYEQLYARVLASAPGKRIRPCSGRQW